MNRCTKLSCPDERPTPPAPAKVEFVFCDHSDQNLQRVADALIAADADIIAIEKIREGSFGMGTYEEKDELSRRMTSFLATDSDIRESASEYLGTEEPLFTRLLDELKGSGKRIVLIDMGTDDEHYSLYREVRERINAYNAKVNENRPADEQWHNECSELYLDYQIATARQNEYREFIMQEQITRLAEDNPSSKIAVMTGALHTPMSYKKSEHYQASRTFVPTLEDAAHYAPNVKMQFDSNRNAIRLLRLNLGKLGLSVFEKTDV